MSKVFNIVISGVGGQGLVTLLRIVSQAAFDKGLDVKTSELHGLSQRGGSVEVYIRFGKQVFSPIIAKGEADFVLALEKQEVLNGAQFASSKTNILINQYQTPTMLKDFSDDEIKEKLGLIGANFEFIDASGISQKELGAEVVSGVLMLGYASAKKYLPLSLQSLKEAVKKIMPEKYWEINIKALELGKKFAV